MDFSGGSRMGKVLIIEASNKVQEMLAYGLRIQEGHQVFLAQNCQNGLQLVIEEEPDLILLDDEAKETEELPFYQQLRRDGYTDPIILFLRRSNRVTANTLKKYNCDHIFKPYTIQNVLGRVHIAMRGLATVDPTFVIRRDRQEFCDGKIVIDHGKRIVLKNSQPLTLTLREYELVCFLAGSPRSVFTREQLMFNVWCYKDYVGDVRAVDVAIRRIRKKLEDDAAKPKIIQTMRGVGYYWGV